MIIFGLVILSIVLVIYLFLQLPGFGKNPVRKRLSRIKASMNFDGNAFKNIEHTVIMAEGVSYSSVMKEFFSKGMDRNPIGTIPSVRTSLDVIENNSIVWFGHSSYLLRIANKNILVDPVFSERASPVQFAGMRAYPGTNVYRASDMPPLDAIIITHDHYDHLDYETIKVLRSKTNQFYTSLGVGQHLERWGVEPQKVVEMDWWEQREIFDGVELIATPARHFSGRGFIRNKTLWSSFVLKSPGVNVFVGGDSGYDKSFRRIGDRFGPFDVAILEAGQYDKKWPHIHMAPEEAVRASIDLQAKVLLPVHWGKFTLALHPWKEPITRVMKEAERLQVRVATPMIGEAISLLTWETTKSWWNN